MQWNDGKMVQIWQTMKKSLVQLAFNPNTQGHFQNSLRTRKELDYRAQYNLSVYFSHPVVFFTNRNPLFYCKGIDSRRNCKDMWVDIAEDGLNGNEELYSLATPSMGVR